MYSSSAPMSIAAAPNQGVGFTGRLPELYDAVNSTIEGIERQPEIGATANEDPGSRRVLVARFPCNPLGRSPPGTLLSSPPDHRL